MQNVDTNDVPIQNPHILLVEKYNGIVTLKNSLVVPTAKQVTIWSSDSTYIYIAYI